MASEMVERCAKALWLEAASFPDKEAYWDTMLDGDRESYLRGARAAIEAMREPTEAMLAAGHKAMARALSAGASRLDRQRIGYSAMIDAALQESNRDR